MSHDFQHSSELIKNTPEDAGTEIVLCRKVNGNFEKVQFINVHKCFGFCPRITAEFTIDGEDAMGTVEAIYKIVETNCFGEIKVFGRFIENEKFGVVHPFFDKVKCCKIGKTHKRSVQFRMVRALVGAQKFFWQKYDAKIVLIYGAGCTRFSIKSENKDVRTNENSIYKDIFS